MSLLLVFLVLLGLIIIIIGSIIALFFALLLIAWYTNTWFIRCEKQVRR